MILTTSHVKYCNGHIEIYNAKLDEEYDYSIAPELDMSGLIWFYIDWLEL